jgi:hypothetical protein
VWPSLRTGSGCGDAAAFDGSGGLGGGARGNPLYAAGVEFPLDRGLDGAAALDAQTGNNLRDTLRAFIVDHPIQYTLSNGPDRKTRSRCPAHRLLAR